MTPSQDEDPSSVVNIHAQTVNLSLNLYSSAPDGCAACPRHENVAIDRMARTKLSLATCVDVVQILLVIVPILVAWAGV
jgi:hypothetical protein